MTTSLLPVSLTIPPWFHDHRFNGRTILPAVEAMRLLALTSQQHCPGLDPTAMGNGRFSRFLEIGPGDREIEVLIGLEKDGEQHIRASLYSRRRLKAMTRTVSHCELSFSAESTVAPAESHRPPPLPDAPVLEVPAERIYRELVPFGPAFRTLQEKLSLAGEWAWGVLQAPDPPGSTRDQGPLGNPFPLDGALHAACVHGQRLVDFVPFPVGFAERRIHQPTRSGERYRAQVRLRSRSANELVYDLWIVDRSERIRETVAGLRMRDASGGRIEPPASLGNL